MQEISRKQQQNTPQNKTRGIPSIPQQIILHMVPKTFLLVMHDLILKLKGEQNDGVRGEEYQIQQIHEERVLDLVLAICVPFEV